MGSGVVDREYGLPTQVRDAALGRINTAPTSDINKRERFTEIERSLGHPAHLVVVLPLPLDRVLHPSHGTTDGQHFLWYDGGHSRRPARLVRGERDVEGDGQEGPSLQAEPTSYL